MFYPDFTSPEYNPQNPDYPQNLKRLYDSRFRAFSAIIEKSIDLISIENGIDDESMSDTAVALMLLQGVCDDIAEI